MVGGITLSMSLTHLMNNVCKSERWLICTCLIQSNCTGPGVSVVITSWSLCLYFFNVHPIKRLIVANTDSWCTGWGLLSFMWINMRRIPHSLFLAFCLLSSLQLSLCCRSLSVLRTCSLRSTRPDLTMCPFVPVLGVAGRGMFCARRAWAAVQLLLNKKDNLLLFFNTVVRSFQLHTHTHTHTSTLTLHPQWGLCVEDIFGAFWHLAIVLLVISFSRCCAHISLFQPALALRHQNLSHTALWKHAEILFSYITTWFSWIGIIEVMSEHFFYLHFNKVNSEFNTFFFCF